MEKYISENDTDETSMLLKIYGHKFKELKYKNDRYRNFKFELESSEDDIKGICINELEKLKNFIFLV